MDDLLALPSYLLLGVLMVGFIALALVNLAAMLFALLFRGRRRRAQKR